MKGRDPARLPAVSRSRDAMEFQSDDVWCQGEWPGPSLRTVCSISGVTATQLRDNLSGPKPYIHATLDCFTQRIADGQIIQRASPKKLFWGDVEERWVSELHTFLVAFRARNNKFGENLADYERSRRGAPGGEWTDTCARTVEASGSSANLERINVPSVPIILFGAGYIPALDHLFHLRLMRRTVMSAQSPH